MDTTTRAGSPLRQRMLEDMRMRKLEPRWPRSSRPMNSCGASMRWRPSTA